MTLTHSKVKLKMSIEEIQESSEMAHDFINTGEFRAAVIIGVAVFVTLCVLSVFSNCCTIWTICCAGCCGCQLRHEHVYELQRVENTSKPSAPESFTPESNGFFSENLKSFKDK